MALSLLMVTFLLGEILLLTGESHSVDTCGTGTVPLVTRPAHTSRCPFSNMMSESDISRFLHSFDSESKMNYIEELTSDIENTAIPGSPEYGMYLANRGDESAKTQWLKSQPEIAKSKSVGNKLREFSSPNNVGAAVTGLSIPAKVNSCPKIPECKNVSKYRSIDGSCNNLIFTDWGLKNTVLRRLVPASYSDGISESRVSVVDGNPLPNARILRTLLFHIKDVPHSVNSLAVMQFGQIVSHDSGLSPDQQSKSGAPPISCCGKNGEMIDQGKFQDTCIAIEIPSDDSFYSEFNRTCISVIRSMTTISLKCQLGPAQQFSSVTHFVDASMLYGSDDSVALSLREMKGGLLKIQETSDGRHFLPNSNKPTKDCNVKSDHDACYVAGDIRVNQHPGVAIVHVLFLREHNRIANILHQLNPHWNDEIIYQESRRIVIAEWQHITYVEWLPVILGEEYVQKKNLSVRNGFSTGYDEFLDPSTLNGFTTAAFRSFHSLIQGTILFTDENGDSSFGFPLREWFDDVTIVQEGVKFDLMVRGLAAQSSQTQDTFFSEDVTNFLFKLNQNFGFDLEAIDIQRGRDHGLAPYNDYREICDLPRAKTFSDFSDVISAERVELLSQVYAHVDDVDLFVGGMLETVIPGTLVGLTFQCIIGEQFVRWKFGDRWFYDFPDSPLPFTPAQLREIKKVTFSRIMCDNGDNITKLHPKSFQLISEKNPVVDCKKIPQLDLTLWREKSN